MLRQIRPVALVLFVGCAEKPTSPSASASASSSPAPSGSAKEAADDARTFAMLCDSDEAVRLKGVVRTFEDSKKLFRDPANARRLIDRLEVEQNVQVRDALVALLADVNASELGLSDRLQALAKNPDSTLKRAISGRLLKLSQSQQSFDLVASFLDDDDKAVRLAAASGLSRTARHAPSPACQAIDKALQRSHAHDFLWVGASLYRCDGLQTRVLDTLDKETAHPADMASGSGIEDVLAIDTICAEAPDHDNPSLALRSRAFELAKRLTKSDVADVDTRRSALDCLASCDAARGEIELQKLSSDRDTSVSARARKKLAEIAKAKSKSQSK